jgi:predicted DNA-binding transcriptional regulator AlpA
MKLLSKKELAERIGRTTRHVERLISGGEGPPVIKLGVRAIGFDENDVAAWIAARRKAPPGWPPSRPENGLPPTS